MKKLRAPKEGYICSVKEGSQIALWSPQGIPEALIITHSDEPPRLVYFDGTEEELSMKDGSIVLPPVVGHSADFSMSVGVGELPNEFDDTVEWSTRHDAEYSPAQTPSETKMNIKLEIKGSDLVVSLTETYQSSEITISSASLPLETIRQAMSQNARSRYKTEQK